MGYGDNNEELSRGQGERCGQADLSVYVRKSHMRENPSDDLMLASQCHFLRFLSLWKDTKEQRTKKCNKD